MPRTAMPSRRRSLPSCSVLALATVLAVGATPAGAQSFLGSGNYVTNPNATGIQTGPATTTINLNPGQTIIDWTPTDNATNTTGNILFQPGGTTATFISGGDFSVLNNINSASIARAIQMDGTVNARVGSANGSVQRGNVYFYAPGGFVFGGTSSFSVGSLVVSASPLQLSGNNFINNNTVVFGQAPNPNARIVSNGTINANFVPFGVSGGESSYVAMVAPRVEHHGAMTVNGSAALVGAEAATINFSPDGLFSIQIDTGTTDANGVVVDGTITGPAAGVGESRRIYAVAVPKNDLLTMTIGAGADLGFEIAGAANVVGNAVVLSAGHDIQFGGTSIDPSAASGADANISITDSDFTSAVSSRSTGTTSVGTNGVSSFASDLFIQSDGNAQLLAIGDGASISVGGDLAITTDVFGDPDGESVTAANATVHALSGGDISITGALTINTNGFGGDSTAAGVNAGLGRGGTIRIQADNGSTLTVGGTVNANASGFGGDPGNPGINAGNGQGGTILIHAGGNDATLDLRSDVFATANGFGGDGDGSSRECFDCNGAGGLGTGGTILLGTLPGTGSQAIFGNHVVLTADGEGGDSGNPAIPSATGTGGSASAFSQGGTTSIAGQLNVFAEGFGGDRFNETGGNGGAGVGGDAFAYATTGGILTVADTTFVEAEGIGGTASATGATSGNGTGGLASVFANSGGTAAFSTLFVSADGTGGFTNFGVNGGDGIGGQAESGNGARVQSSGVNSSLTVNGFADISADGRAGSGGECISCGGAGGDGIGGDAWADTFGASSATLTFNSDLTLSARGEGGIGVDGPGGNGQGGEALLQATSGATATVEGRAFLDTNGYGGDVLLQQGVGVGGNGTGGTSRIQAYPTADVGGIIQINGNSESFFGAELTANGFGGGSLFQSSGVSGGDGTGGTAEIIATGGSITIGTNALAEAIGEGGNALGGTGGNGTGGYSALVALHADVTVLGTASLDASGRGGDGLVGGDGIGGGDPSDIENPFAGAEIFASDGDITINGSAIVTADGHGGDGSDAEFGDGFIDIGPDGGLGGDGFGGGVSIVAGNNNLGPSSITIAGVESGAFVSASGFGGAGGDGRTGSTGLNGNDGASGNQGEDGSAGGAGGAGGLGGGGGSGTGGFALIAANAGNGELTIDFASATARGEGGFGGVGGDGGSGGTGGNGGSGDALPGGNGGAGGDGGNAGLGGAGGAGIGGNINVGTSSGSAQATEDNLGLATIGSALLDSSALGGQGGNGGFGGSAGAGGIAGSGSPGGSDGSVGAFGLDGNGGDGGDAFGGGATLLVRGSTVDVGLADLLANATGGDGGFGGGDFGIQGAGGDATVGGGGVSVLVTERFFDPPGVIQRGNLLAGPITGDAIATGGAGSVNGASETLGGSSVVFRNSDGDIASLDFEVSADGIGAGAAEDFISIINSDVIIDGTFSFNTVGELSLYTSRASVGAPGTLTAGTINLSAANFVPDSVDPEPAIPGTIFADNLSVTSGGDFIADANLDIVNGIDITVPGSIRFDNAASDAFVSLHAQGGPIAIGTVDAGSSAVLLANGSITGGAMTAGAEINLQAQGSVTVGALDASGFVFGRATGAFTAPDIDAGEQIDIRSGGALTLGNLVAGDFIDLRSNSPISILNALSGETIRFQTLGSLTTGNLTAGNSILGQAVGAINVGQVSAGLVGASTAPGAEYRVSFASDANITTGTVNAAGNIGFATPGNLVTGNLSSGGGVMALVGTDMTLGDVSADEYVYLADYSMSELGGEFETFDRAPILASDPVPTGGSITVGTIVAGSDVDMSAGTFVAGEDITAGGHILVEAGGSVSVGNLSAGLVNPTIGEGADHSVKIVAGGNILTGDIAAADHIGLATPATMTTGDIDAGGIFMALGHGDMSFGDATASEVFLSDFAILNIGGLTATCIGACGTLGADGVVTAPPSGPSYAYVTTDGGVDGAGQLSVGGTNGTVYTTSEFDVAAGEALDFFFNYVTSDGSGFADYAWAALLTPNLDPVAILYTARTQPEGTIVPGQGLPGVEATLDPASVPIIGGAPQWSALGADSGACFAAGCGYTGWVSSSYEIAEAGSYVLRFGVSNWSDSSYQSGMAFSGLSIGGVSATPTLLTRTGGSISIGNVETGRFSAAAGTSLTTGIIDSSGSIALDAGGAITTANLFAGNFVLGNGGTITTGNIEADSVDMTSSGGDITTGEIFAFGSVEMDAFGAIVSNDITAGSIDLAAGTDITTGDLTTEFVLAVGQESPGPAFLFPGASITLESGADVSTGTIDSIDGVYANAGGSISTGNIEANDFVELHSVAFTDTGHIVAGSDIFIDAGGDIDTGDLDAGVEIDLDSGGSIEFGDAEAGIDFGFEAGGPVDGGDVLAGLSIEGEADGSVSLGNLTAGFQSNEAIDDDTFSVGIQATGPIDVGNVQGANRVGFATLGDLDTGSIQTGWDFLAFADGDIDTGAITTGAGDRVFMSGTDLFLASGGGEDSDFDPNAALAQNPTATGGSIVVNGPVNTGAIQAAAGENFIANAITATGINSETAIIDGIEISAGGTAAVNGAWNGGSGVRITSNDINITANGTVSGNEAILTSTNATQTIVGDGVQGGGYQLADAEFDRISAGIIQIGADASLGAAPTMFVGDLSVQAPGGESGVEYQFVTHEGDNETGAGTIRVVGDAIFSNMQISDVFFTTGTFQLDAETATLALTSNGTDLAGNLGIEASNIHVASGTILDQLADDPQYSGYQQDLNAPAAVQRPDGVVRAATIEIDFEGSDTGTVYVQNTGTSETPAGFLVSEEVFLGEDEELDMPAGSIDLVINGQIQGEGTTLTGIDVRDAMVEAQGGDITPFTSNSTINGCPLTGACIVAPPPPPPTSNVVDNQIDLLGNNPLGDSDFGNEEDIDDNEEGDEGADNPISPPQPLFDTRPLVPSGDVNDPVSGTGNPALLGSEQQCEVEEGGQCPADPANGDGQ